MAMQNPGDVIDPILSSAVAAPPLTVPSWSEWTISDYSDLTIELIAQSEEHRQMFVQRMIENEGCLREKMVLFWSGLLVARQEVYMSTAYAFKYHQLLHQHGLGNAKQLIRHVGLEPGMLVFLNGLENVADSPNENYARELFELFTLGVNNNYTQQDITESARAFTGYNVRPEEYGPISFDPATHDTGVKTIFGQTGNWDYDDVIDILFQERENEVAKYLSGRIYKFFIGQNPSEAINNQLSQILIQNNFEILPLLDVLFKSELFFDMDVIETKIKYPSDLTVPYWKEMGVEASPEITFNVFSRCAALGEFFFSPFDVSGYPDGYEWISTSLLPSRWMVVDEFIDMTLTNNIPELIGFVQGLVTNQMLWTDPHHITRTVVDHFITRGLEEPYYVTATIVFKADVPQNYYDLNEWNLGSFPNVQEQIALLLRHIIRLPEFQLG